eukprot:8017456-Prorocentrum_lima.AAC.1
MHVCTWILADPSHQDRCRMMVEVTKPVRLWHGLQVQRTRSVEDAVSFALDASAGYSWFDSLRDTIKKLQDRTALEYIGFCCSTSTRTSGDWLADHPVVVEEDKVAGLTA